jgi:hypothetical protein
VTRNAFITTYLTKPKMDRHPHKDWPVSFEVLQRLAESVQPYGELIVCADELKPHHVPKDLRSSVTVFPVTAPIGNVYFEFGPRRSDAANRSHLCLRG